MLSISFSTLVFDGFIRFVSWEYEEKKKVFIELTNWKSERRYSNSIKNWVCLKSSSVRGPKKFQIQNNNNKLKEVKKKKIMLPKKNITLKI